MNIMNECYNRNRKVTEEGAGIEKMIKMGIKNWPVLLLVAIMVSAYFYTQALPPAEPIDDLLAKADVLIIPVAGEIISYEIPANAATFIGLDGREIGVEKYYFSTGGDNPSSATGFTTIPGAFAPGDKEEISFNSPNGNGKIVLKFY
jgi:hypothetical protein